MELILRNGLIKLEVDIMNSVLLDTSFFIRLLNVSDNLHKNAVDYYKYFLENDFDLKLSTISIAEYCVKGKIDELPLKNVQILPYNLNHALKTGVFASFIFSQNKVSDEKLFPRAIIPNDSKLFAQAETEISIDFFVTSDKRSKKTFSLLNNLYKTSFEIIDISISRNEIFN